MYIHYYGTLVRNAHLPVCLHVHTVVRPQWHMHYCQVKVTGSFLKCRVDGTGSNLRGEDGGGNVDISMCLSIYLSQSQGV